jgi:hypothetical protein
MFFGKHQRFAARMPTHRLPQMGGSDTRRRALQEVIEVGGALVKCVGDSMSQHAAV